MKLRASGNKRVERDLWKALNTAIIHFLLLAFRTRLTVMAKNIKSKDKETFISTSSFTFFVLSFVGTRLMATPEIERKLKR